MHKLSSLLTPVRWDMYWMVGFYNMESLKRHTTGSDFDVAHLDKLPKVGIVYSYSNVEADVVIPFWIMVTKGIIHAGVGMATFIKFVSDVGKARQQGILVVRSSRVPTDRPPLMPRWMIININSWLHKSWILKSACVVDVGIN